MPQGLFRLALAVFIIFSTPFPLTMNAGGEEAKPEATPAVKVRVKPEAKPVTSLEDIKNLLSMSLYFQGGYTFNFENPDSGINRQRIFDQKGFDSRKNMFDKKSQDTIALGVMYSR